MGEMIKFGIKLAMTIACAVALMAAILILYNLISTFITGFSVSQWVIDISRIIGLCLPFNPRVIMTVITSLFAFKVAYWAADKMIQFITASS